jgi:protocatechuate 3,4-dioxygenase beta subunit
MGRRRVTLSRGGFLRLGLALPAPLLLAACGGSSLAAGAFGARPQAEDTAGTAAAPGTEGQSPPSDSMAQEAETLAPTPACADEDDEPTPTQTEGPYFKPNSPQRQSLLEAGLAGTRLVITGRVLETDCRPVARALLDFWQADERGAYDNTGYRLRGHQFTTEAGQYRLETIVPGLYPGRTRHIHVKVQAPNRRVLTTQLYFPDEARNARDSIFNSKLLLAAQDAAEEGAGMMVASFDFVLA